VGLILFVRDEYRYSYQRVKEEPYE